MSQIREITSLDWEPVRPDVARDIFGRTLMEDGVKVVLTRVAPGGGVRKHRDQYGHLLYFLSGEGIVQVNDQEVKAKPGLVVRVMPGETHAYANTGAEDLMLISMNLPEK